ncbi:MAG: aspartate kinase, partial [Bacteroidales bacterium]|nr:aspartate kinase [Bacteroidales bacterium]
MKVLKFGGTSVGQPARMHKVAKIVTSHKGPKIVILSALSGTTNSLVKIGENLSARKHDDASQEIEALYTHYLKFQDELVQKENSGVKAQYVINEHFSFIRSLLKVDFNENYTKELLARGELLSTELFSIYLEEEGY